MAPRPHNRGHYSIDACDVSQFDLQVRAHGRPAAGARRASTRPRSCSTCWATCGSTPRASERTPDWADGAGAARRAPAPVRQGQRAAGPQDGPPDPHRRRRRRRRAPRRCRPPRCWACRRSEPPHDARRHRSAGRRAGRRAAGRRASWWPSRPRPSTAWAPRADDDAAVAEIFAAKGRPGRPPADRACGRRRAGARASPPSVPPLAQRLIAGLLARAADADRAAPRRAWPRPPPAGRTRIGLRCPAHPVAQALLRALRASCGVPGVAGAERQPLRPRQPDHARRMCRASSATTLLVLDGGACAVGIESSIVDCTRGTPVLLRPGVLTRDAHRGGAAASRCAEPDADAPRASGTLEAHYAPRRQAAPDAARRLLTRRAVRRMLGAQRRRAEAGGIFAHRARCRAAAGVVHRAHARRRRARRRTNCLPCCANSMPQGVQLIWVEAAARRRRMGRRARPPAARGGRLSRSPPP